jgi:hypothetical protein
MNLTFSDSREIESAYIIRLSSHPISAKLSDRCKDSCDAVGMPWKFWEGFDGTIGDQIRAPEHLLNKDYLNWVKVHDNKITTSQIACVLSHFSLWCHCLTIDKPIVILEHDAIMLQKLEFFPFYNMVQYLGSIEQMNGAPQYITPPHGSAFDKKLKFICRAHAYAIDPQVSKNLITRFIQNGITNISTADIFIRADIFPIIQHGLYAYDSWEDKDSTVEENPL